MRATLLYGAGDVRIETVPDAGLSQPTDAVVRVTQACICGSDLWPYKTMERSNSGRRMGHEAIGVVEAVGPEVRGMKAGDLVVMPFAYSDGTCEFCHEHLQTSCIHGGFFGSGDADGAQAEALRVPLADGTLVTLPVSEDDASIRSLLTLSDVMGTGHHAAVAAKVTRGKRVAVVGDGAVGLCGVIAAKRLGAEQITRLGELLERCAGSFRVVMIHHPPASKPSRRFKRLLDGPAFRAALARHGAELVIHGHDHERALIHLDGPQRPIPVVGVPSASEASPGEHDPAGYNLYRIEGDNGAWGCEVVSRGLTPDGKQVVEIERMMLAD